MTREAALMVVHRVLWTLWGVVAIFTVTHMGHAIYDLYRFEQFNCDSGTLESQINCLGERDVYLDRSWGHTPYFLPGAPILLILSLINFELGMMRLTLRRRAMCKA